MASHESLRIFVGYDEREAAAFHTCCQSIIESSSWPVQITPLALGTLARAYRERHSDGSNAFVYSRFLVPWLCGFSGHALYLDGDMLITGDVAELFHMKRLDMGVQVVKHDYVTKRREKYLGSVNEDYPRKNYSSVMLWNCAFYPNRKLTPEFVASKTGAYLHRFMWLDDERIGDLPVEWNWLCGEYEPDAGVDVKLYHYTLGSPCFDGYQDQQGAREWFECYRRAIAPMPMAGD